MWVPMAKKKWFMLPTIPCSNVEGLSQSFIVWEQQNVHQDIFQIYWGGGALGHRQTGKPQLEASYAI